MPHNFIPDPATDSEYLAKVYEAAKLGSFDAMVKLSEYAGRRGAIVEAFYWLALADLKGAKGLNKALHALTMSWMAAGCPAQHDNVYAGFPECCGMFSRALLRLRSGVDAASAVERMRKLAEDGCEEAGLILKRMESGR